MDFVQCHPSKTLFVRKHPDRKTIEEEVNVLKRLSYLQPLSTLKPWDEYLKQHNKSTNEGKNFINGYQVWNQVRLTENNLFV